MSGCWSLKMPYATRREAQVAANAILAGRGRPQRARKPMEPYDCPDCPGWHLRAPARRHDPRRV